MWALVVVLQPGSLQWQPKYVCPHEYDEGRLMRELREALRSGDHTNPIESRLLRWGRISRSGLDGLNADDLCEYELITKAWRRLGIPHRDMIKMVYVWRANREIVCRRLRIKRAPASVYDLALAAARRAMIVEIREQLADENF